jgi:hypothetical protein
MLLKRALVLAALVLGSTSALAGDKQAAAPEPGGQPQADMQAMMADYMQKYGSPGPEHQHLKRLVGRWDVATKMWMGPDAPATEGKAKASFEPVFGGRFVMQKYRGEFMGMAFDGLGFEGFDRFKQKYTSLWMDSMGTALMLMTGTCDADGQHCNFYASMDDAWTGERDKLIRAESWWQDDDTHGFRMFDRLPGGKEFKVMEAVYTRSE